MQEKRTAGLVADHFRKLGLEVRTGVGGTGVMGVLRGEKSGREYGLMHACGHDIRTTVLLGVADVLSRLRNEVPETPEEVRRILGRLKKAYAKEDLSTLDGLKINFGDAWVHIRPSNTEPIIRVLAEARTEDETRRLLDEFKTKLGSNLTLTAA